MSEVSQIDIARQLLQQTYDKLEKVNDTERKNLDFEEVYSNGLIEFAGKQEILWAILFGGENNDHSPSIASHLQNSVSKTASMNAEQLVQIHTALLDVCPILYLKGACLIVEKNFHPAPWRSMTDIDFLVPRDRLDDVLNVLRGIGFRTGGEKYNEALHAHYPMLKKAGYEVGVEVHTRLFRWPTDELLAPKEMFDACEAIETQHGPAHIPEINHRIIHLIIHAQLASNRFARREFLMRDALEFRVLSSRVEADLDVVRQKFKSAGYESAYLAFVGMADRIMDCSSMDARCYRSRELSWIEEAWIGIQDPETLVRFRRTDVARNIVANALTPSRWKAIVQALSNGDEFVDLVRRIRKAFFGN